MKYAVEFPGSEPARCTLDTEHVGHFVLHRIDDDPRAVWQATQVTAPGCGGTGGRQRLEDLIHDLIDPKGKCRTCQAARDDTVPSTETP